MRRVLRSETMQRVTNASTVANNGAGTSPADHARSERMPEPQFAAVALLHAWPGAHASRDRNRHLGLTGRRGPAHDGGTRAGVFPRSPRPSFSISVVMRPT